MGLIDWNSLWDLQMLVTDRARLNDGFFWDKIAKDEKSGCFTEELTAFQMDCLSIKPDDKVLEIGPGKGRLTKELVKNAKSVTVLDPSELMLEELSKTLLDEGLKEVQQINSKLEDVDQMSLGQYDLVVASYSLFMMDMKSQLEKMNNASSGGVCIFVPANLRIPKEVQSLLRGTEQSIQLPDHVVLFNLLWDMGIHAEVLIYTHKASRRFKDMESALQDQMRFHNVPEEKREIMADYVSSLLKKEGDELVIEQQRSTAMLRWNRQ